MTTATSTQTPANRRRVDQHGAVTEIVTLARHGAGWTWTARVTNVDGAVSETTFRTNREGQGLWRVGALDDQQVSGTAQFSLPAERAAVIRRLLSAR